MSCKACATSCTKQLNLLNDAIWLSLNNLSRDADRHGPRIERRCQSEIVQFGQRRVETKTPGLDPRVFLDVRRGLQEGTVQIEIGRECQQPVGVVRRERWDALPID